MTAPAVTDPIEFERDGYTYHVEVRAFLPGQPTASQYATPADLAAARQGLAEGVGR